MVPGRGCANTLRLGGVEAQGLCRAVLSYGTAAIVRAERHARAVQTGFNVLTFTGFCKWGVAKW